MQNDRDYLHGDCMHYAVALADRYGWETVAIYTAIWDTVPCHVAAITPEGFFADVRSYNMTEAEFVSIYNRAGDAVVRPISVSEIRRIWKRRDWTHQVQLRGLNTI